MNDLGHSYDDEMMPMKSGKKEIYYPSETFTEDQLPGLAGKKAGDTVKLTIEAKVRSVEVRDIEGQKKKTEYRIELRKGYCDEGNSSESKSDKIAAMSSGEKKKLFNDEEE